ncbi:hypothetical protein ACWC10_04655 [Streptomyces sp. NPDC001595]|uniref:hypothetical protein n=1 Tax=Streptomyces sp. NPDC001532 TaxID=3154520 RepID=UPI003319FF8A
MIWIVSGVSGSSGQPSDCDALGAESCNDAETVGTAIGVGLVIVLWAVVDLILGIGYAVCRLAARK